MNFLNIFNNLFIFHISALFITAKQLISLFYHMASTPRTLLRGWLLPGHKFAIRVVFAPIIFSSLLRLADHHILAADRARHADLFQIGLGIPAPVSYTHLTLPTIA